jgi:putative oxygen-independent coproporphyrinogen III oxidase
MVAPMFHFTAPPPLALYVHIPWCVRKCPYCDFNSHTAPEHLPADAYVRALLADLDRELSGAPGRRVETVFIGGGTPSLLSPLALGQLLEGLHSRLCLGQHTEITLEANPGTLARARLAALRALGINRLSLGVQSFDDAVLHRIGRIHDGASARRAVEDAQAVGLENINIDLMFALPGQTPAMAEADLRTALGLAPAHLSYYQLTIEPNTLFYRHPPALPDDETAWSMQRQAEQLLANHGYTHYETSAYAKPQRACGHNMNYWRFGDYLGIGAGAHGKRTDVGAQTITRHHKHRQPGRYMQSIDNADTERGRHLLSPADAVFEFMLNALRLSEGFSQTLFTARTGLAWERVKPELRRAQHDGLLRRAGGRTLATPLGQRFLNDLSERFLPPDGGVPHERID